MKYRCKKIILRLVMSILLPATSAQAAVLWTEQARRLQEVSAALLDTIPVPMPLVPDLRLGLKTDLSFLPSPNTKVGSKREKLPSSPVQSIPSFFLQTGYRLGQLESISVEGWGGVLPQGVEKMMGIQASLLQTQIGARIQLASARLSSASIHLGGGFAKTSSSIKGTISSLSGSDSFTADAFLSFVDVQVQHIKSGFWGGLSIGKKTTQSRLAIVDDATDLSLTDQLTNAKQPHWSQFSLGLNLASGFKLGVSELFVPDRLEMPRLSVAWSWLSPSSAPRE
ncbi:hypothetical protein EBU99_05600 [bacterium]|nr:hypothetical protein [bacterium]